jgi:quinoprotein dehydrogenase-associated probable ABC transporter substrate-binding protein
MSSRFERLLLAALVTLLAAGPAGASGVLRVCSDPNNLPYSNDRGEGFENEIAALVARDMGKSVSYFWWPQRLGFIRKTLNAGKCDVIIGLPGNVDLALTTRPYYRSSYVFVSRRDRHLRLQSFDDPRLHKLKIGVQIIGDDYANSPPAHALANRGIVNNVVGYTVYPGAPGENRARRIVEAVAAGEVDVSAVWGPTAGYFARRSRVPLAVTPVTPEIDLPFLPFVFDISMAVRRGDNALRDQLDEILERRRGEIETILRRYGVPRVDLLQGEAGS